MRTVQVSEMGTQFSQLLDAVGGGETVVVTRRGRSISRLVPDAE
jgi:prevent-host-death family protein